MLSLHAMRSPMLNVLLPPPSSDRQFIEAFRLLSIYALGSAGDPSCMGTRERPLRGNGTGLSLHYGGAGHRGRTFGQMEQTEDDDGFTVYSDEPGPLGDDVDSYNTVNRHGRLGHVRFCEVGANPTSRPLYSPADLLRLCHMHAQVCTYDHYSGLKCLPWKKKLVTILESFERQHRWMVES